MPQYVNPSRLPSTGPRHCHPRRIRRCFSAIWTSSSTQIDVKLASSMTANKLLTCLAGLLVFGAALPAGAQLRIEVTSGVTDPVPIAVVPFSHAASAADGGLDVAQVVQHDLEGSGRFKALPRGQMPATPTQPSAVVLNDWK